MFHLIPGTLISGQKGMKIGGIFGEGLTREGGAKSDTR